MTPLRQRMLDALLLRGMAVRTQEAYIDAVARLARHYRRSPDVLTADEVQEYLLHLLRDRRLSRSSVNQYGCAFRFFYGTVLDRNGDAFQIPLAPAPQRLPEILSREELAQLFAMASHLKSRTFLMLAYGTGLRLSELCHLRVADIDSHADRMCIRVEQGKGGKDRYVPLAPDVLDLLRAWWHGAHPRNWLFSGRRDDSRPLDTGSAQHHAGRGAAALRRRLLVHARPEHGTGARVASDRRLSHAGARWPTDALRRLWRPAVAMALLPQSALPAVPEPPTRRMALRSPERIARCSVLPLGLHLAA